MLKQNLLFFVTFLALILVTSCSNSSTKDQSTSRTAVIEKKSTNTSSLSSQTDMESTSQDTETNVLTDEYIIPTSDNVILQNDDINGFSLDKLELARNEIFARHGYIFTTPHIRDYFQSKKWYKPNKNYSESDLSKTETANIQVILNVEENFTIGKILNLLDGTTWFNESYINDLKSTKSPSYALENPINKTNLSAMGTFSISKNNDKYYLYFSGFHQGGGPSGDLVNIKKVDNEDNYIFSLGENAMSGYVHTNGKSIFKFKYTNQKIERISCYIDGLVDSSYIKMDWKDINKILLSGEYKDEKGQKYVFNDDGLAVWKGKSFKYDIELDYFGEKYFGDYFRDLDSNEYYVFEIKGNTLTIYETISKAYERIVKNDSPYLVLYASH